MIASRALWHPFDFGLYLTHVAENHTLMRNPPERGKCGLITIPIVFQAIPTRVRYVPH